MNNNVEKIKYIMEDYMWYNVTFINIKIKQYYIICSYICTLNNSKVKILKFIIQDNGYPTGIGK